MQTHWSDTDLFDAIRGRESDRNRALQYLVQHAGWRLQVLRHVLANSGTEEDGEEVFFEALCTFDRNLREDKYREESALSTYFMGIAKNKWLKRLAKHRPVWDVEQLYPKDRMLAGSTEETIISAEHEAVFARIMAQIGERCKRIFELFHLGHSMAEIAVEVGIRDADQAKKEKNRCKNRLLNLLAERPELRNFFNER